MLIKRVDEVDPLSCPQCGGPFTRLMKRSYRYLRLKQAGIARSLCLGGEIFNRWDVENPGLVRECGWRVATLLTSNLPFARLVAARREHW